MTRVFPIKTHSHYGSVLKVILFKTKFNKIANQATVQMAVDKEAVGLSRYEAKCDNTMTMECWTQIPANNFQSMCDNTTGISYSHNVVNMQQLQQTCLNICMKSAAIQ